MLQALGPNARRTDISENQILPSDPASKISKSRLTISNSYKSRFNPVGTPFSIPVDPVSCPVSEIAIPFRSRFSIPTFFHFSFPKIV